jgi:hypothetical protein
MDPTQSLRREAPKSTSFPEKTQTALEIVNKGRVAEGTAILEAVIQKKKEAEISPPGQKTVFQIVQTEFRPAGWQELTGASKAEEQAARKALGPQSTVVLKEKAVDSATYSSQQKGQAVNWKVSSESVAKDISSDSAAIEA